MNLTCISLDLEMTTSRPENQHIIEIAAIKFRGQAVLSQWSTLVNPRSPIPYNIKMLTGIDQPAVDRAPVLSEVIEPLLKFIGDAPLVGHSIGFDVDCLARNGIRLGNQQLDTFELASILLPQLPEYSLAALTKYFDICTNNQHRAAEDAMATRELFLALWQRAIGLDLATIQEITRLGATATWAPALFFMETEKEKLRLSSGSSIRDRLMAKGLGAFGLVDEQLDGQALKPVTPVVPLETETLTALLEPGGAITQQMTGYEHRPEQIQMLREVCAVFNENGQLLVEAGTGVGKSMAYLLPAIYFAVANQTHIVVSTNTINLQDQLYSKDLPDLAKMLEFEFRSALVKGRANYLCRRRWEAIRHNTLLTNDEISTIARILVWLPTSSTGDVAELNINEKQRAVWSRLHSTPESCLGRQCEYQRRGRCYVYRARELASFAHIIVTNHALLLSDAQGENKILPDYDHVIIDEAHHFEDEATSQFAFDTGQRDVERYLDDISHPEGSRRGGLAGMLPSHLRGSRTPAPTQRELAGLADKLVETVDAARSASRFFFDRLACFVRDHGEDGKGYEARLRLQPSSRAQPAWAQVDIAWANLTAPLSDLQDVVSQISTILNQLSPDFFPGDILEDLKATVSTAIYFNTQFRARVESVVSRPNPNEVCWVSTDPRTDVIALHAAPLYVGELLNDIVYRDLHTMIMTSATLSIAGNFDYIRHRLGLPDAKGLIVGSPFDYARSTLLYLPDDIVEPERPNYQKQVQQAILELCRATGGRALCLFTSHNQLRQTWQAVRSGLEEAGIQVLAQGIDGSPRQLLRTFRANPKSVILGSASFWEGVDVVGEALSVLAIARLPFAVPTDPLVAARSETFDDPFNEYSVPQSVLRFKQGFGRLIRSKTDRGIVVVLDKRVQSKAYGSKFLKSLPACTQRVGPVANLAVAAKAWLHSAPTPGQPGHRFSYDGKVE